MSTSPNVNLAGVVACARAGRIQATTDPYRKGLGAQRTHSWLSYFLPPDAAAFPNNRVLSEASDIDGRLRKKRRPSMFGQVTRFDCVSLIERFIWAKKESSQFFNPIANVALQIAAKSAQSDGAIFQNYVKMEF